MFKKRMFVNLVFQTSKSLINKAVEIDYPWYRNPCFEVGQYITREQEKLKLELGEEVIILNIDIIK